MKTPFSILSFFNCRAKRCKCQGSNDVKIVTSFGCHKGGIPDCPDEYDLYCKDGTHLSPEWVLRHKKVKGRVESCVCKDGIMPRCKATGDLPKCPNGDDPDPELGHVDDLVGCRVEPFDVYRIGIPELYAYQLVNIVFKVFFIFENPRLLLT